MRRWLLQVFGAATCMLVGASAAAHPSTQLRYNRGVGAESCPDDEGMRSLLVARLGYDPVTAEADERIVASIVRDESHARLRGRVEVHDAAGKLQGKRELSSAQNDCTELASSMALAIAIAIDPLSLSRPTPPKTATDERRDKPAAPNATADVAATPDASSAPRVETPSPSPEKNAPLDTLHLRTGAGVVVAAGNAPSPTVGAGVLVGVGIRALSIDLEGRLDTSAAQSAPRGEVTSSLQLLTLAPCLHIGVAFGCGLASAGRLHAASHGVDLPADDASLYAAFGGRLGAEWFFSRALGARAHIDVLASPTRITLLVNERAVWSMPTFSGLLGADLLAKF